MHNCIIWEKFVDFRVERRELDLHLADFVELRPSRPHAAATGSHPGIDAIPLIETHSVVLMPPGHALAAKNAVAETAPDPIRGNLIGGLAGLSWGLTIIGLRWLGRETEPGTDPSAAAASSVLSRGLAHLR